MVSGVSAQDETASARLIARGNTGVRLFLTDGTRLLIGSQRPEALALAVEKAIRPAT